MIDRTGKKYIVTGGAGFIGAAVARQLVSQGAQVTTIDNLSTGYSRNIPEGVRFIQGDCQSPEVIEQLGDECPDAILHIAGQSSGEVSFEDPIYDLQTNTQSTLLLLRHARRVGCSKFIFASTMSVYGDQPDVPVNEDATCRPKSLYGVGKLASEHYLRIYSGYGISCTALRLFNVYGPGQNMANLKQGMISIFLAQAVDHGAIVVKGSLDRYRDFVFIDDVVRAFELAADRQASGYCQVNISTGIKTTIAQVLSMIQELVPAASVRVSGSTPGDQFGIYADTSSAENLLGFRSRTQIGEGMRVMYNWYEKHRTVSSG